MVLVSKTPRMPSTQWCHTIKMGSNWKPVYKRLQCCNSVTNALEQTKIDLNSREGNRDNGATRADSVHCYGCAPGEAGATDGRVAGQCRRQKVWSPGSARTVGEAVAVNAAGFSSGWWWALATPTATKHALASG